MARNPANIDQVGGVIRTDEEIRQLRIRRNGVAGWQTLEPYLTPGWATPVNTSVSDLADDFCPRFYIDRSRVYLGGVVQLDRSLLGSYEDYFVLDALPAGVRPERLVDIGLLAEDMYWTNSGWLPHTGQVTTSPSALTIITGGVDDPIDDGVAISLETISWRIDG